MKKTISLLCMAAYAFSLHAVGTNPPYIIPLAPDGTFHKDGNDYVDKVQMTAEAEWYELDNVDLTSGGFIILGMHASGTTGTLYTLTGWAVESALITWPNPLGIAATDADYIDVEPGVYDIRFHERDNTGSGYNMVSLLPSANPDAKVYPPSLYLVTDDTHYVELPGTAAPGEYSAEMTLPDKFVVAYEHHTGIAAFIFGPENASDATPTGLNDIETGRPDAGVRVDGTTFTFTSSGENSIHDICGRRMFACHGAASVTLSPGVYIVTAGGRTTKMHAF